MCFSFFLIVFINTGINLATLLTVASQGGATVLPPYWPEKYAK